jgi:hypothetical protein
MKKMTNMCVCLGVFALLSATAVAQSPTPEQTQEANIKAYISMLRKDFKRDKVAIITELMQLGPQESSKFWPVYNDYDKLLTKLADERLAFIRMYADNFSSLTPEMVTKIATGMMDVEGRRLELRKQYFQRVSQTLTPKDAIRWLHVEAQIERVVDLQILSSLPIVE